MNKIFKVKCPQCQTVFSYYESECRPFCSERCKKIDLGHWFHETYAVPVNESVNSGESEKEYNDEEINESEYEN